MGTDLVTTADPPMRGCCGSGLKHMRNVRHHQKTTHYGEVSEICDWNRSIPRCTYLYKLQIFFVLLRKREAEGMNVYSCCSIMSVITRMNLSCFHFIKNNNWSKWLKCVASHKNPQLDFGNMKYGLPNWISIWICYSVVYDIMSYCQEMSTRWQCITVTTTKSILFS